MAEVKWIKITVNMFDDEKIKIIEKMPEGRSILLLWIKLLTLAGKCNATGYIFLSESIPYSDEMLSTVFRMDVNIVRMGLQTFERFNMIELSDDNVIKILNWDKHQNIEGLDKIRQQTRNRVSNYRKNQKLLSEGNATCNVTVTECNAIDIEEDIDKEKDIETIKKYSSESVPFILAQKLKEYILSNNPNAKVPEDLQKWSKDIDLMIQRDKRTPDQIQQVIEFSQKDSFWKANILSAGKLRDKFDTLWLQKDRTNKSYNSGPKGNFEQRNYDDSYYNNLYDNLKKS